MPQDQLNPSPGEIPPFAMPAAQRERPPGPGRVAIAGVFGACALGAGLGMWARPPAPPEPPRAEAGPPEPELQVVMTDNVAPVGQPLEVLPADVAAQGRPNALPRVIPVEPQAPRLVAGLVKVDALVAPAASTPVPVPVAPPTVRVPRPAVAEKAAGERPAPKAKVAANSESNPESKMTKVAKAEAKAVRTLVGAVKAAPTAVATKAKAAVTPKPKPVQVADAKPKVQKARSEKTAKAKVEAAKVAKADKARVEKAKVVKVKATKPAPAKKPAPAQPARAAKPKPAPPVQQVHAVKPKPAPPPPRKIVIPRGEGPMRMARNTCASADPGAAMVCSDSRLAARDRQLQQAYRNAEAAGVPASALRRQQARWIQARAAAARDAPWAVEDVYEARISELNDLSRDAREY